MDKAVGNTKEKDLTHALLGGVKEGFPEMLLEPYLEEHKLNYQTAFCTNNPCTNK